MGELKPTHVVTDIVEKPKHPESKFVVTGIYFYNPSVFAYCKEIKPSARAEYEITDVNRKYVQKSAAHFYMSKGFWSDAGVFETYRAANEYMWNKLELPKS